MKTKPIFVTQPSLAPLEEYFEILEDVWESGILTHNGPLVQRLEKEICTKLGLQNLVAVSNGTIALQMAIKALGLKGEIITTPFTWIATVSAIKWEGCTPVFCDIDHKTLNIDTAKIEEHITDKTVGIMPVHVFGNPCNIDIIEEIGRKYSLKIIYDAAHAVGSTYMGKSLLEYGDISAASLHATKLLNTAEGGCCITKDVKLHEKLKRIRFFGHNEEKNDIIEDGFNGKMTEVHAALGLANMKYHDEVLADRKNKYNYYLDKLQENTDLGFQQTELGESNFSYFPVIFKNKETLINTQTRCNRRGIFPRKYFHPSVNTFSKILEKQICPISEEVAQRILCFPLYWKLEYDKIDIVIDAILSKR